MLADADADHPDWKVLLTEVRHRATDTSDLVSQGGTPPSYHCAFTAIPFTVPYRPARITPKPFVRGPQTAKVTGPAGENIYTDKYGRVKVRFHWDRNPDGDADENSSCWLRVSQVWAGKGFGAIHIPRFGQEVIVDFLEGDPDQPIITGRVYNAIEHVPFDLDPSAGPEKAGPLSAEATRRKTWAGFKSRSTPGNGHNELIFVDDDGKEEIYVRAQKDLNTLVEHDERRHVKHDRTTHVNHDEHTHIGNDKTTQVDKNFKETIDGTETRKVVGDVKEIYLANETRDITGNVTETVTGSYKLTATAGVTITTPATTSITGLAGTTHTETSWWKNSLKDGKSVGTDLSIIWGQKVDVVNLAVGATNIKIDATGLKIEATHAELKNKAIELASHENKVHTSPTTINLYTICVFL